jgi:hypothetical protein
MGIGFFHLAKLVETETKRDARRRRFEVGDTTWDGMLSTGFAPSHRLVREHDDENWEFRSWLKQNAPDNIDGIVKALSQMLHHSFSTGLSTFFGSARTKYPYFL